MTEPITYVSVTQNRLQNVKRNLEIILPYVDRAVIVDGGSSDGTAEYLDSLAPKVKRVYRKWDDNFSNQYNEYLKHIDDGWVLIFDDDELPSKELLESLQGLIQESNFGQKFSCVEFRSNPQDPEAGWDPGPANHYRQVFFRKTPHMRYVVDLHQSLRGYQNNKIIKRNEVYYHIKTRRQEFQNACRNFFIGGWWPPGASHPEKDHTWQELKSLISKHYPEVQYFSDLNNLMIKGNLHPELKEFILKYKNIEGAGYGELRAYAVYYFEMLHPEEA